MGDRIPVFNKIYFEAVRFAALDFALTDRTFALAAAAFFETVSVYLASSRRIGSSREAYSGA